MLLMRRYRNIIATFQYTQASTVAWTAVISCAYVCRCNAHCAYSFLRSHRPLPQGLKELSILPAESPARSLVVNPRRACAARVTVVVLCVCLCVQAAHLRLSRN